ncbi:porin [Burkholderia dolosa]|uniref:porin n=1 Tax=Burkholderia dolosa TaxID=152500 RepID=UPI003523A037
MLDRKASVIVMLALAHAGAASAQSSVTLFGVLDSGVSYVSNEGGHGNAKLDDGIFTPSVVGLRGSEDLGGGTHAIFGLVSQISTGNGSIVGNALFARTAFVGLQQERYGTLTFGNQYEFMADTLFFSGVDAALGVGGLYNLRNGPFQKLALPDNPAGAFDWDRLGGSQRVANAAKYVSPTLGGLKFGALYGFGGVPGSIGANSTVSAGADYSTGTFGAAAAFTNEKYGARPGSPATSVLDWGAGVRYRLDAVDLSALFTTVRNAASGGAVWMSEFGGAWKLTAATTVGADYMYMKGNAALDDNHAHQVTATIRYSLSKRTIVYASGVWQRANVGAHAQIGGVMDPDGASSGATQAIARIGVNTVF